MACFRALLLVAPAVLAVLSDCIDVPTANVSGKPPPVTTKTPTSATTEPTPADLVVPTETDKWYTDCNTTLSIDPVGEAPNDATVSDCANLSTERHAEFDAAAGGSNSAEGVGVTLFSKWIDTYEF